MLPVPSPLFLRRTIPWNLADVGDEQEKVRHPVSNGSSGLCGCQREARRWTAPSSAAQATRGHRVAIHSPVHAAVLRRELAGAEHAPCRRRARTAVPSGTGVLHQARPRFSGGTVPVIVPDDA